MNQRNIGLFVVAFVVGLLLVQCAHARGFRVSTRPAVVFKQVPPAHGYAPWRHAPRVHGVVIPPQPPAHGVVAKIAKGNS